MDKLKVGFLREPYFRRLLKYTFQFRPLLAVVVLMGVTGFLLSFVYPWLIGSAIDDVIVATDRPMAERSGRMLTLIGLGVATAVGHALVTYTRGHFNVQLGNSIVTQLRRDLFDHLQRLSLQFYARERTGSIMTRLLHDVHGATAIIYGGLIVVGLDVIQLLIAFGLLMSISWKLTVACLFILPAYAVTFKVFNPFVRRASERLHHHYCYISGNVQEQLTNMSLVKSYAAEDREAERFGRDVADHHGLVVRQSHFGHMVGAVGEVLVHVGTTIVFGYGGWLALKGEMTAGDMTRFLGYIGIMYGPIQRFAGLNMVYQNSITAMRRVFRVFDITPKIRQAPHAHPAPPARADVRFEDVRFRYVDDSDEARMSLDEDVPVDSEAVRAAPWVLNGITLHARPGERVALVGPSGSGKTTLVSLLPRLYDVGDGRITIDGRDIRDYALKALRTSIGIVQQDAFIFSGTIRDNISYGRPGATMDEIVAAARAANAHTFITEFPQGYDTKLGERGVNLSGGQKQRVSIARALLKDPKILILDEATSALDAESEALVQQALDRLMHNRTCFIVAHRLSTVRNADRIYVLDHGRVAEAGTHDELVEQRGLYARLVRHQFHNAREKPATPRRDREPEPELVAV